MRLLASNFILSIIKNNTNSSLRNFAKSCRSEKSFFITTPIFYVNSSPHIGHLYTALLADAAQRFQQLTGDRDVLFMTGTDEHGTKIQQAASKANSMPLEYCNKISSQYKELFHKFGIKYTHFIRTTNEKHVIAVQRFWSQLQDRGHLYEGSYAGWYCVADESFLSENQLAEIIATDGTKTKVSAESGRPVEWTEETNFKFRLSNFQQDLLHWLKNEQVIKPAKFHSQLLQWITDGTALQDVSVSRPAKRVHWGVPVPGAQDQTVYVWLDALVSYLTAAGYPDNLVAWPPHCQMLGKDILKFHGVYWPAFLIAAGLEPPSCLTVHSHWTVNDEKMSKSQGNVVSPSEAAERFTASGLRYFLLRDSTLHSDANYRNEKVMRLLNAELADTLGNLLNRCCGKLINANQQFPRFIPEHYEQYCRQEAEVLVQALRRLPDEVGDYFSNFNYYQGVDVIIYALREANRFFESQQPWNLRKSTECQDHLICVLHVTMETLRICGIALQPIVPEIAEVLLDKLAIPKSERSWNHMRTLSMNELTSLSSSNIVLFRKIFANK